MNTTIVILAIFAAVGLIIFLAKKNQKDKQKFEDEANRPDVRPEKHEDADEKI